MYVSINPHKSLADQDSRHIIQWTLLFYFMVSFMGNLSDVNIFQGNVYHTVGKINVNCFT